MKKLRTMTRKLMSALLLSSLSIRALAQDSGVAQANQSQGFMESGGKIGVVMVVCLVILAGLILYLVRLDRKISRLEKK
jgi:Na+-translocating ferredoxin:NAD+ oxidoreductase RnfD subunit